MEPPPPDGTGAGLLAAHAVESTVEEGQRKEDLAGEIRQWIEEREEAGSPPDLDEILEKYPAVRENGWLLCRCLSLIQTPSWLAERHEALASHGDAAAAARPGMG